MKQPLSVLACAIITAFSAQAFADTVPQNVYPETTMTSSVVDAEIVSALEGINKGAMKTAKMAAKKSMNPSVQQYAQQVMIDHRNAEKQLDQIRRKNRLTVETPAVRRDMRQENTAARRRVNKLDGAAFDQAFLDEQINQQQQALQLIDNSLLKKVDNIDLRAYINNLRTLMDANLQTARQLRAAI
ncbi:MAG: DUF4142 domain-containing protein [Alistipes senegalensis]|nr:DUF4142 domain-containing protein [Oxalobacter formigenes]MCM1281432.1 DUF4142 domain-containing protein [Alistipes senegalensis]